MKRRDFIAQAITGTTVGLLSTNVFAQDAGPSCNNIHYPPKPADFMVFPNGKMTDITNDQGKILVREVIVAQGMFAAETVIVLLNSLDKIYHGFQVSQLEHSLQSATRAYRGNATDEWILAALCHDMMKVISPLNHDAMAAEVLKYYVSDTVYQVIKNHQTFEGQFYYDKIGRASESKDYEKKFSSEAWYQDAMKFTVDYDECAFETGYKSFQLKDFESLIHGFFEHPIHPTKPIDPFQAPSEK